VHKLFTSSGVPVKLGTKIGAGGEGVIYALQDNPQLACKVYRSVDAERQIKLKAMLQLRAERLRLLAAWPIDTLHTLPGGPVCGFSMLRMEHVQPVHKVYSPHDRKREFPQADWRFLATVASNICAAIDEVHAVGCVVGDINENSVLVDNKALVRLIDCDSFQVSASGQTFPCRVGVPLYTPPELHGMDLSRVARTANHDRFGLAVHIFHLLMMGRHPYAGRHAGRGDIGIDAAIASFKYAYKRSPGSADLAPPPNSVPLSALPSTVTDHFERAFLEAGARGGRATAAEWHTVLSDFVRALKKCPRSQQHYVHPVSRQCPWCELEDTGGVLFFLPALSNLDRELVQDIRRLGLSFEEKLRRLRAIRAPVMPVFLDPTYVSCVGTPTDPALLVTSGLNLGAARVAGAIVLVALFVSVPGVWLLWLLCAWGLVAATRDSTPSVKARVQAELKKRSATARAVEAEWKKALAEAPVRCGFSDIEIVHRQVQELEQKYRALPQWKSEQLQRLESQAKERQLFEHLDQYTIRHFKIPGIGPTRISALLSNGIETAADVTVTNLQGVQGIGPGLSDKLVRWKRQQELRFRFDPKKGASQSDIVKVEADYRKRIVHFNASLDKAAQDLVNAIQRVQGNAMEVKGVVNAHAHRVAQAHADVQIVEQLLASRTG